MNFKLAAVGLLISLPYAAFAGNTAEPVAASLAATFGGNLSNVAVNIPAGTVNFDAPTSLAISAASGDRVTASAIATNGSSGALAAATTMDSNVIASVEMGEGNAYESFVSFAPDLTDVVNGLVIDVAALQAGQIATDATVAQLLVDLGLAEGDIDALQAAVLALETCTPQQFAATGTGTSTVRVLGTDFSIPVSVIVTGTTVCTAPV